MNQLFIGALDFSDYLKGVDFDNPNRWVINCWNVPETMCEGIFVNPIIRVPFYLHWRNDSRSSCAYWRYAGFPNRINCAEFLFLEYAPYTEIDFMFSARSGRFGHHIKTRLYMALGEES